MSWWQLWRRDIQHVDVAETDAAEKELVYRKERGAAVHAEVKHIVERNNLAEKFHTALTIRGNK